MFGPPAAFQLPVERARPNRHPGPPRRSPCHEGVNERIILLVLAHIPERRDKPAWRRRWKSYVEGVVATSLNRASVFVRESVQGNLSGVAAVVPAVEGDDAAGDSCAVDGVP